jgi:hypothetical protein
MVQVFLCKCIANIRNLICYAPIGGHSGGLVDITTVLNG